MHVLALHNLACRIHVLQSSCFLIGMGAVGSDDELS